MRRPSRLTTFVAGITLAAVSAASVSPVLAEPARATEAEADDSASLPDAGTDPDPGTTEHSRMTPGDDSGMAPGDDLPGYIERYSRPFVIDGRELELTQKYFWGRLFHPERKDRTWGVGVLMASFVLASQKRAIQSDVAEDDSPNRSRFFKQAQQLGGRGIVPAAAVLMYLGGSAFRSYHAKQTGVMLGESALLTGILCVAGQWVLSEDRPNEGGRLHPFKGIGHGVSGHTATAASISGILSRQYFQIRPDDGRAARTFKRIGKGFAYGAPVVVAFGRVNDQQHFAYSTLLGLGIGFWTSNVVADAHGLYMEGGRPRLRPTSVAPIVGDHGEAGIGATWEF